MSNQCQTIMLGSGFAYLEYQVEYCLASRLDRQLADSETNDLMQHQQLEWGCAV
jgi:hypothetical protein